MGVMKATSVTIKVGEKSQTFSDPKSENPLRAMEQAREWLKEQHVALARERDKDRVAEHRATQAAIARKLGRTEIADAIEAGDSAQVAQLEAQRLSRLSEIDDRSSRSVKPDTVRVKARGR